MVEGIVGSGGSAFVLNAQRAEEEKLAGASTKKTKGKAQAKGAVKRKKAGGDDQIGLLDEEE